MEALIFKVNKPNFEDAEKRRTGIDTLKFASLKSLCLIQKEIMWKF